jgi:hypothetical protein
VVRRRGGSFSDDRLCVEMACLSLFLTTFRSTGRESRDREFEMHEKQNVVINAAPLDAGVDPDLTVGERGIPRNGASEEV